MSKSKKIILFIVEGSSDKESIGLILSRIIESHEIRFHIIGGDICSEKSTTSSNVIKKLWDQVNIFMDKNGYKKNDIHRIVHLIDTDGIFIPPDSVVDMPVERPIYFTDRIEASDRESIINRNRRKATIVSRLYSLPSINHINYTMYYFSANNEHVLHNILANHSQGEKMILARDFASRFEGSPNDFIGFISNPSFAVPGTYRESWDFIMQGLSSLNRFCNFHLFFTP
jgi:hypothetical protein